MCWRGLPKLLVNLGGLGESITFLILPTFWTMLSRLLLMLYSGCTVILWEAYAKRIRTARDLLGDNTCEKGEEAGLCRGSCQTVMCP